MEPEAKIKLAAGLGVAVVLIFGLGSLVLRPSETTPQTNQKESVSTASVALANLPSSFPSDFPVLTQSRVTTSKDTQDEVSAVFLTTQSIEFAQDFFEGALTRSPWKITDQSQAAGLTIHYLRKESTDAILTIGKGEEGTTISVTIPKS